MIRTTRFSEIDRLTLAFILVSGIFAVIGVLYYGTAGYHVFIRLLVLALIILMASTVKDRTAPFRTFYPLMLLPFFYAETDCFNNFIFPDLDQYFAWFEQWVFRFQPSLVFQQTTDSLWFRELMYSGYFSYYILIILVSYLIYRKNRESGYKAVFFITSGFYIFYLIFYILPVTGPQYYFSKITLPENATGIFTWLINFIQDIGERPTAAFPSSHIAMSVVIVLLAGRHSGTLGLMIIPFVILLAFSTVYIRAHYVIDVLAGFLISPFIYLASKTLFKFLNY